MYIFLLLGILGIARGSQEVCGDRGSAVALNSYIDKLQYYVDIEDSDLLFGDFHGELQRGLAIAKDLKDEYLGLQNSINSDAKDACSMFRRREPGAMDPCYVQGNVSSGACQPTGILSNPYTCDCPGGYLSKVSGEKLTCVVDHCAMNPDVCGLNKGVPRGKCINSATGYTCKCTGEFAFLNGTCRGCGHGYRDYCDNDGKCSCYRKYSNENSKRNFSDASKQCVKDGGQLASIMDPKEQDFIFNKIWGPRQYPYFIGLTDIEEEGSFKWLDSTEFKYSDWESGDAVANDHLDCVVLLPSGKWKDYDCATPERFVCERQKT